MLLKIPHKYRSQDDDYAPVDYTYVDSVAEGERRRQSEPIHRSSDHAGGTAKIVYPRPRNNTFADAATVSPKTAQPLSQAQAVSRAPVARSAPQPVMPEAEPVNRSRRSAHYPQPDPAAAPDAVPPAARNTPASTLQAPAAPVSDTPVQNVIDINGSRYAPPPAQAVPDWMRASRQNHAPVNRRPPRVETAPPAAPVDRLGRPIGRPAQNPSDTRAEEYVAAGYPEELVARQRNLEAETAYAQGYGHRSHGAQAAAPAERFPAQPPPAARRNAQSSYPPPREEYERRQNPYAGYPPQSAPLPPDDTVYQANPYVVEAPEKRRRGEPPEDSEGGENRPRIPYLGIAVFLAALLLVTLWILEMNFTGAKQTVLAERAAVQATQLDTHPFKYRELIEREAAANNLHPAFIAAIVYNESSFNPQAESSVGARGLMQMMPDTAEWVHGKIDSDTAYSFDLMYDPDTNVKYACWYLASLSNQFFNDPILVAAAFHAGQTTVKNWLANSQYSRDSQTIELQNMAEGPTKNYVSRVLNSYAIYRRLYYEGGLEAVQTTSTAAEPAAVTP
ncbi:MAG: transglycosylase SLT domain-containing protein [Eubacteriales bacterium]|nr:transglycosylase SLT domain-containing protein [Eubacteriales bacterium]